jgi:hypothetical protein
MVMKTHSFMCFDWLLQNAPATRYLIGRTGQIAIKIPVAGRLDRMDSKMEIPLAQRYMIAELQGAEKLHWLQEDVAA